MNNLSFPFIEVSGLDQAFGYSNHSNFTQALKACPEEFRHETAYSKLFSKIFFKGLSKSEMKALKFRSADEHVVQKQFEYLRSIMTSFEPQHEDKEALCSWILSLIIEL